MMDKIGYCLRAQIFGSFDNNGPYDGRRADGKAVREKPLTLEATAGRPLQ